MAGHLFFFLLLLLLLLAVCDCEYLPWQTRCHHNVYPSSKLFSKRYMQRSLLIFNTITCLLGPSVPSKEAINFFGCRRYQVPRPPSILCRVRKTGHETGEPSKRLCSGRLVSFPSSTQMQN